MLQFTSTFVSLLSQMTTPAVPMAALSPMVLTRSACRNQRVDTMHITGSAPTLVSFPIFCKLENQDGSLSQIYLIKFTHPSFKEPIEKVWRKQ